MKQGDESARNILIERNLRLVAHIAKKYSSTNIEQEDLISIGTIGLMKAINSFNIEIIGFVFVILSLALTIISGVDYFIKSKDVLKDM